MDYQVWVKEEFGDTWKRQDAGDKDAALRIVLDEVKDGRDPVLTVLVPFEVQLIVGEPGSESKKTRKKETPPAAETLEEEVKSEADPDPAVED